MSASVEGLYAPTLEVTISTGAFDSDWANCERVSSYVARAVSHNRRDPLLHYNLLSSALNEILELAFRAHAPGASISCSVLRKETIDRIVLDVPGNEELNGTYRKLVDEAARGDSAERLASETAAAQEAAETARRTFEEGALSESLPTVAIAQAELEGGLGVLVAFVKAGLVASNGEARRQIKGGGLKVNDAPVTDEKLTLTPRDLSPDELSIVRDVTQVLSQVAITAASLAVINN